MGFRKAYKKEGLVSEGGYNQDNKKRFETSHSSADQDTNFFSVYRLIWEGLYEVGGWGGGGL